MLNTEAMCYYLCNYITVRKTFMLEKSSQQSGITIRDEKVIQVV